MHQSEQAARASLFRELNMKGALLLPNAWDAASARIFEEAGFPAIGTTSAGIAYTRGYRDGEQIGRDTMMREVATIVTAVQRPVTADVEAGYGAQPEDVAKTIDAVLDAGAVGVNLEDNAQGAGNAPLFGIEQQVARLAAARAAADRRGIPLVINARTDTFLMGLGADDEARVAMTVERGRAYLDAGADLVFVPVLVDPAIVRRVVDAIGGPVSLMAGPGAPPADALFAAGAHRVSVGGAAMLATLGLLRTIAREMRASGTWTAMADHSFAFRDAQALFTRA